MWRYGVFFFGPNVWGGALIRKTQSTSTGGVSTAYVGVGGRRPKEVGGAGMGYAGGFRTGCGCNGFVIFVIHVECLQDLQDDWYCLDWQRPEDWFDI